MEAFGSPPLTKSDPVYIEAHENFSELVMNRPDSDNAENWPMVHAFHRALDRFEKDRDIQAVVIRGEGRSFSSGVDLDALSSGELGIDWFRAFDEALRRLEQLDCLTVAKIHGEALGAGFDIALACDLRVASQDTRLGVTGIMEGLIPGMLTYRLPRFIGLGRARRMVLTGESVDAAESQRIGLLDWVVPPDQLDDRVRDVVAACSKGAFGATAFSKKLITRSFQSDFNDSLSLYLEFQNVALKSEEHGRAMAQYRTRRRVR